MKWCARERGREKETGSNVANVACFGGWRCLVCALPLVIKLTWTVFVIVSVGRKRKTETNKLCFKITILMLMLMLRH